MEDGGTDVNTVSSHGGVGSATGGNFGSVVVVGQHQIMGTGSGYYLRGGQPRQLQSQSQGQQRGQMVQSEDVGAGDDVDGHGVGGTSGSDVEDLDTTFEGDDPVDEVQRPPSLIGDQRITTERRHSSLIGSLQTTEELRQPAAAAVCDRGESITGFKPHSSHVSSDGNCSDSVDYSRIQQVMDLVRDLTEDDDDVIHPSWRQLVQSSNGGRTSDICSDGPCDPVETPDNRSSGNVCAQGPPVKHTRFRCGTNQYTDDQVDVMRKAGEHVSGQDVNTNERGEYHKSRIKMSEGQVDNTSKLLAITNASNHSTVPERYVSTAFLQVIPRHGTDIGDVADIGDVQSTHEATDVTGTILGGQLDASSDPEKTVSTAFLHLALKHKNSDRDEEVSNSYDRGNMESTYISHLALERGANLSQDVGVNFGQTTNTPEVIYATREIDRVRNCSASSVEPDRELPNTDVQFSGQLQNSRPNSQLSDMLSSSIRLSDREVAQILATFAKTSGSVSSSVCRDSPLVVSAARIPVIENNRIVSSARNRVQVLNRASPDSFTATENKRNSDSPNASSAIIIATSRLSPQLQARVLAEIGSDPSTTSQQANTSAEQIGQIHDAFSMQNFSESNHSTNLELAHHYVTAVQSRVARNADNPEVDYAKSSSDSPNAVRQQLVLNSDCHNQQS